MKIFIIEEKKYPEGILCPILPLESFSGKLICGPAAGKRSKVLVIPPPEGGNRGLWPEIQKPRKKSLGSVYRERLHPARTESSHKNTKKIIMRLFILLNFFRNLIVYNQNFCVNV